MKVKVRVSIEAFADKESAIEKTPLIKKGFSVKDTPLTIQQLAQMWLAGHSIAPVRLKRGVTNDANWISQQVFAIDFDNENGDKERVSDNYCVTFEDALDMARQSGVSPAFIYSSFSSTDTHQKFRMVFVLDQEITSRATRDEVLNKLYSVFKKNGLIVADTKCSDLGRIFYGGNELLYEDYAAVNSLSHIELLGVSDVPRISQLRSKLNQGGQRIFDSIPVSLMKSDTIRGETTLAMTAIINGDSDALREHLHKDTDSTLKIENICTVYTNIDPYETIKRLPLHLILGVPLDTAFRCILHGHEDVHPSAIVRQLGDGKFAYFCHGCYGKGKGQSLIDLIIEATDYHSRDIVSFIEAALGRSIQTEHQRQCRSHCERILSFIQSADFRKGAWEPLFRYLNRKKLLGHYRYYLETVAQCAIAEPLAAEGIPIFFEGVRETSDRMAGISYCTGIDKDSVSKKRNELADLGLIVKISGIDHPAYSKAQEYRRRKGNPYSKEFLQIPDLDEALLESALQTIDQTKQRGERSRFKSRAATLMSRGEEAADRVFTQDSGSVLSRYQNGFISTMMQITSRLTSKGWTTEDEIITEMIRTSKFSGVKRGVGQFRPYLTNGDIYTLQLVTNELRRKLNLPDILPIRKKIIIPVNQIDANAIIDLIFNDDPSVVLPPSPALP
ncbi:hypothetical protein [Paenibacillus chungangensis]|uniref:Uncharacterized protein n=1 Tax=Paenibacillus chungangensis TaxID=696535 RepID=A0ABW3HKJ1_9BACL